MRPLAVSSIRELTFVRLLEVRLAFELFGVYYTHIALVDVDSRGKESKGEAQTGRSSEETV